MTNLNRSDHAFPTRFQLQTGGADDVSSRISSVFDSLNGLEAKHQAWERSHKDDTCSGQSYLKEDPEDDFATKPSPTSDGVFKRPWSSAPCGPRKRPRGAARSGVDRFGSSASSTPDYKVHPERWTCYSLDSVPEEDMSEASNKAAALDYLRERRLQREHQSQDGDGGGIVVDSGGDASARGRHVFQKRSSDDADMEDATAETTPRRIGTGKLVMPECVVGVKPTSGKKACAGGRQRSSSLPAGSSSSLISFDCADFDDDRDELDVDDEEDVTAEVADSAAERVAVKKGRMLRARTDEEDD
ncbi:hypothetical protein MTO96_048438 [Rhipicephalus appendiculatus]|uniref:U5 small nuclear ribonucleoprotein TSSC4 n=1 Tax=Rhipicephalus appendiculatus TaxID=34631 RepID=A0A131YNI5_RHIAP